MVSNAWSLMNYPVSCVWLALHSALLPLACGLFEVEIVSIGVHRGGSFLSFFFTGPGIDMGVEDLRTLYNGTFNVSHTYLSQGEWGQCYEVAIQTDPLLSEWYYTKRRKADLYVFIAANCAEQLSINRLAAAWNIMFISGYGTDRAIRNKNISPTWITTSPSSRTSYRKLFTNILARFSWTSIYVVTDVGSFSSYPYYSTIFNAELLLEIPFMQLTMRQIDSSNAVNFGPILKEFRETSRILFFMGPGFPFRQLMLEAAANGMTDGEYVYIGFKMFRFDQFGLMDWRYGDHQDTVAREAFRSALLVSVAPSACTVPERLFQSWNSRTQRRFNVTLNNTDTAVPWPVVTSTYAGFLIFGQVLNETLYSNPSFDFTDGSQFVRLFWNRTYHLSYSDIFLDHTGERTPPMIVEDLNPETGLFDIVLYQDNADYDLHHVSNIDWGGPSETANVAPRNTPLCGYSGDRGLCSPTNNVKTTDVVAAIGCLIAVTACLLLLFRRYRANDAGWWHLEDTKLITNMEPATHQPDVSETQLGLTSDHTGRVTDLLRVNRCVCPILIIANRLRPTSGSNTISYAEKDLNLPIL